MAGFARLLRDFEKVREDPPHEGCTVEFEREGNFLRWKATIAGPKNSVWEGGIFPLLLIFPENYPVRPPTVTFRSEMYHPNVFAKLGKVCMNMLDYAWDPSYTVYTILSHVQLLLKYPNANSPANGIAASSYQKTREEYEETARRIAYECSPAGIYEKSRREHEENLRRIANESNLENTSSDLEDDSIETTTLISINETRDVQPFEE